MTDPAEPPPPPFEFVPATIEATAYHESGHAVIAIATGMMRIDGPLAYMAGDQAHVPVVGRDDREHAFLESGGSERAYAELLAIVSAAGTEAERLYLIGLGQAPDPRQLFAGAHADVKAVGKLVGNGQWNDYRAKACAILQRPEIWDAVSSLAEALIASWPEPLAVADAMNLIGVIEPAAPIVCF